MIITDIKTTLLSVPFEDPPKIGFVSMKKIDLLIVEIETSSGLLGMGYLHPIMGGIMQTIEMCIHEMLKPLLIGKNAEKYRISMERYVESHFHTWKNGNYRYGYVCNRYCSLGFNRKI